MVKRSKKRIVAVITGKRISRAKKPRRATKVHAVNKPFDAEKVSADIVSWIKAFFAKSGRDCKAVVGISGGKDSAVTAALCVAALGRENVVGVLLPRGADPDVEAAAAVAKRLGIKFANFNIADMCNDVFGAETGKYFPICLHSFQGDVVVVQDSVPVTRQAAQNFPARLRMALLYAVAQSIGGRVANTSNLSEIFIGYCTRYGDDCGDFSPLAYLTSDEVKAVGYALGVPKELLERPPADGLCGKTDEENLGFTYAALNTYIRTGKCDDPETFRTIEWWRRKNAFKRERLPEFKYFPKAL